MYFRWMILVRSIMHVCADFVNRWLKQLNYSVVMRELIWAKELGVSIFPIYSLLNGEPIHVLSRRQTLRHHRGACLDAPVSECQAVKCCNAAIFFVDIFTYFYLESCKVAGGKAENEFHVELLKGHLTHILREIFNLNRSQQQLVHVSARIKRIGAYCLPSSQSHGPQNIAVPCPKSPGLLSCNCHLLR